MQKLIIFALVLSFMVFSLPQWASADQSASPDKRMASEYISEGMYEDFEKNAEAVSASAEIAEPEVPASSPYWPRCRPAESSIPKMRTNPGLPRQSPKS